LDTTKVTRVEVINWRNEKGRVYGIGPAPDVKVTLSLQDDGRTLKVFIDKKPC
jgi:hypothetical protein